MIDNTAITIASAASASLEGMGRYMEKPLWQALHHSAYGVNELLEPVANSVMIAGNASINQPNGISATIKIAEAAASFPGSVGQLIIKPAWETVHQSAYLTSGSSATFGYLNKIHDSLEAFINPQTTGTRFIHSMAPDAHLSGMTAVAGSLLDLNRYKNLGISDIMQSFRVNGLERIYAGDIVDSMKAAAVFTQMGEDNLSRFDWTTTGGRYDLSKSLVSSAQTGFLNFTAGYRNVLESVGTKPNWLYEAPIVAKLPALEYYTSSQILRLVSDEDISVEEVAEETKKSASDNSDYLLQYLPMLDDDLPMMWHGAVHALRSDNPDKIRHFITSLRELFTHVLHMLAPDEAFARWDTEKAHYDNGKPTRHGRLLFICRNMTGSDVVFAKFMKNDVDSAISLIRMFQSGTHKIKSNYSPQELELILIRAELSLRTFLKVEFDINRR
jgi:hypothetical protein